MAAGISWGFDSKVRDLRGTGGGHRASCQLKAVILEQRDIQEEWTAGSQKAPRSGSDPPNPVYGIRPVGSQRGVSISGQEQKEKEEGGEAPGNRRPGPWRTSRGAWTEKPQGRASQNSHRGRSRASPQSRDLANTQDVCENTRMSNRATTHMRVSYTDLLVGKPFGRGTRQSQLLRLALFSSQPPTTTPHWLLIVRSSEC